MPETSKSQNYHGSRSGRKTIGSGSTHNPNYSSNDSSHQSQHIPQIIRSSGEECAGGRARITGSGSARPQNMLGVVDEVINGLESVLKKGLKDGLGLVKKRRTGAGHQASSTSTGRINHGEHHGTHQGGGHHGDNNSGANHNEGHQSGNPQYSSHHRTNHNPGANHAGSPFNHRCHVSGHQPNQPQLAHPYTNQYYAPPAGQHPATGGGQDQNHGGGAAADYYNPNISMKTQKRSAESNKKSNSG